MLEQAWQQYRKQGVVFLGVDYHDVTSDARTFLAHHGVTYPTVQDGSGDDRRPLRRERGARDVLHRPQGPARRRAHRRARSRTRTDALRARGARRRSRRDRARRRGARRRRSSLAGSAAAACAHPHTSLTALEGADHVPDVPHDARPVRLGGGAAHRASSSSMRIDAVRDRRRRSRPSSSQNFGAGILAAPPHKGFDLLAWWLPLGGVIVGAIAARVRRVALEPHARRPTSRRRRPSSTRTTSGSSTSCWRASTDGRPARRSRSSRASRR